METETSQFVHDFTVSSNKTKLFVLNSLQTLQGSMQEMSAMPLMTSRIEPIKGEFYERSALAAAIGMVKGNSEVSIAAFKTLTILDNAPVEYQKIVLNTAKEAREAAAPQISEDDLREIEGKLITGFGYLAEMSQKVCAL